MHADTVAGYLSALAVNYVAIAGYCLLAVAARRRKRTSRALFQREQVPYAYVTVEATVEFSEITNDDRVDIAVRYLGEVAGNAYVGTVLELDEVLVRLTPQRWRTCDYSKLDT